MPYDEAKKEFVKCFNSLQGKKDQWTIWNNYCEITATAIDVKKTEKKEEQYRKIASGYTRPELETMAQMTAYLVEGLEDKHGDFLGECFMDAGLNDRKGKAQIFTPYTLSKEMASLFEKETLEEAIKEKGYLTVYDPCVGGGALLIAFLEQCKEWGFNYQKEVLCFAGDLDRRCCRMTYIQLSLLGANLIISEMNSLTMETFETWYSPLYWMNAHRFRTFTNKDEVSVGEVCQNIINENKKGQLQLL